MDKPTYIGEWIKGDTLSDLLVRVQRGDGSGAPYDLTLVTEMKLELRSLDGATKIVVNGAVGDPDPLATPVATNGWIRFQSLAAAWTPPGVREMFEFWVTLKTSAKFGYCRPSMTLAFRRAP